MNSITKAVIVVEGSRMISITGINAIVAVRSIPGRNHADIHIRKNFGANAIKNQGMNHRNAVAQNLAENRKNATKVHVAIAGTPA